MKYQHKAKSTDYKPEKQVIRCACRKTAMMVTWKTESGDRSQRIRELVDMLTANCENCTIAQPEEKRAACERLTQ